MRDMNVFKDFFVFVGKPDGKPFLGISLGKKVGRLIFLFVLCVILSSCFQNAFRIVLQMVAWVGGDVSFMYRSLLQAPESLVMVSKVNYVYGTINTLVLSPILMLCMFFLGLKDFDLQKVRISLSCIGGYVLYLLLVFVILRSVLPLRNYVLNGIVRYAIIALFSGGIYVLLFYAKGILKCAHIALERYFPLVFYVMVFLFILVYVYMPIFFFPGLLVTGVVLGYTRIRLGIGYAFVLFVMIIGLSWLIN